MIRVQRNLLRRFGQGLESVRSNIAIRLISRTE